MAGYNRTRYVEQLLEKTESSPPSFTVHLYPEYWVLNNGSKFLYHNQIAVIAKVRFTSLNLSNIWIIVVTGRHSCTPDTSRLSTPVWSGPGTVLRRYLSLSAIHLHKLTVINLGCMVVELLDYRPQKSKEPALKTPEKTRVILHPNAETLYEDICSLNTQNGSKWTDQDALEIEAKLLVWFIQNSFKLAPAKWWCSSWHRNLFAWIRIHILPGLWTMLSESQLPVCLCLWRERLPSWNLRRMDRRKLSEIGSWASWPLADSSHIPSTIVPFIAVKLYHLT